MGGDDKTCVREWVCMCVVRAFRREMWKYRRGVENKIAPRLPRWRWYLFFSHTAPARQHSPHPAFVLQSCESPCFNACRLTMHCYYTVFMFTSCVIWPKESLQSERLMQNLCLYGCFSQWKNQYCRLDAQKWLSALWLTLKAQGDWELHLLFKESSVLELLL